MLVMRGVVVVAMAAVACVASVALATADAEVLPGDGASLCIGTGFPGVEGNPWCSEGNLSTVCIVRNATITLESGCQLQPSGSLVFHNTFVYQAPCTGLCYLNVFTILAAGDVVLEGGSVLMVPDISIQAARLRMDNTSVINVTGMNGQTNYRGNGEDGSGGSHGGLGALCGKGYASTFDSYSVPAAFGGSGSVLAGASGTVPKGGGVVYISVVDSATIYGQVLAEGESAAHQTAVVGGAAGGAIYIAAPNMTVGPNTVISVAGGDASPTVSRTGVSGGGGGGGRVALYSDSHVSVAIFKLLGGTSTGCPAGGTATLYYGTQHKLMCGNEERASETSYPAYTRLDYETSTAKIAVLDLTSCSLDVEMVPLPNLVAVTVSRSKMFTTDLRVNGTLLLLDSSWIQPTSRFQHQRLFIKAHTITMTSSIFTSETLIVNVTDQFTVGSMSIVKFTTSAIISAASFTLKNNLIEAWIHQEPTHLLVQATETIEVARASVVAADVISLQAPVVLVEGTITARGVYTTSCGLPFNCTSCASSLQLHMSDCSYSMRLRAGTLYVSRTGSIQAAGIRFCVNSTAVINGAILASNFGCPGATGPGTGTQSGSLPTGGGGHGGHGGPGVSSTGVLVPGGPQYDSLELPRMMGSGGGGGTGGAGGGVIHIYVTGALQMNGGLIAADGQGGLKPLKSSGQVAGGGGAGGTVALTYEELVVSNSVISARGGIGGGSAGGGGGGIVSLRCNGTDTCTRGNTTAADATQLRVEVDGGKSQIEAGDGQEGSKLSTPPCGPGSFGPLCVPCPVGYYKSDTGQGACTPCSPGTYAQVEGATKCLACPANSIAPKAGSGFCDECPATLAPSNNSRTCGICRAGFYPTSDTPGNLRCNPCKAGWHKLQDGNFVCSPCKPGAYSTSGQVSCTPCSAGSHAPASAAHECLPCDVGHWSTSNASACVACAGGQYAPRNSPACFNCSINTFASKPTATCATCPVGSYAPQASTICTNCTSKPRHAHYTTNTASCDFVCDTGYLEHPHCLSAVEISVAGFGHWYIPLAILGVFFLAAAGPAVAHVVPCRADTSAGKDVHARLRRTMSTSGQHMTEFDKQDAGWTSDAFAAGYAPLADWGRTGAADPRVSTSGIPLSRLMMNVDDLAFHLHRVYFHGRNSPTSPSFMDPIVPQELRTVVKHAEYAGYAEPCNRAGTWTRFEVVVLWLLRVVYYPLSTRFAAWVRDRHSQVMCEHHLSYDYAFLRNTRARALANSLKLGISPCHTLAWLDVLCMQNEDTGGIVIGQPRLPLVLPCAGEGSYFLPFYLPLTDPLVVEGFRILGGARMKAAIAINVLLRTVRSGLDPAQLSSLHSHLSLINSTVLPGDNHAPVVALGLTHAPNSRPTRLSRLALVILPRDALQDASNDMPYHIPYSTQVIKPSPAALAARPSLLSSLCNALASPFHNYRRVGHPTVLSFMIAVALVWDFSCFLLLASAYIQLGTFEMLAAVLAVWPLALIVSPCFGLYAQYRHNSGTYRRLAVLNCMSCLNAVVALVVGFVNRHTSLGQVLGVATPCAWLLGKVVLSQLINLQSAHAAAEEDESLLQLETMATTSSTVGSPSSGSQPPPSRATVHVGSDRHGDVSSRAAGTPAVLARMASGRFADSKATPQVPASGGSLTMAQGGRSTAGMGAGGNPGRRDRRHKRGNRRHHARSGSGGGGTGGHHHHHHHRPSSQELQLSPRTSRDRSSSRTAHRA